ncbi:MAG: hypothetical protein KatS3mg082_2671 [Nitrospiraceae bacterium]|nr:MAG: hypothetical protein KatS3mg082_2671 [Nitrospiraceae bacterium]
MTEAPVIVLDHLSEAQRRALVIADNRLAQNAGWDEEMLRVELEALREDDFNLDLLGFEDAEIEASLAEPDEAVSGTPTMMPSRSRRRPQSPFRAMCGCLAIIACCAATRRR